MSKKPDLLTGMKKGSSYFPQACEISADLTYDEVVHLMLQGAVQRVDLADMPETRLISST